tara:strand:- start:48 stop:407 length:360 start_codon:yes stop_codon:yes gene_type:complete
MTPVEATHDASQATATTRATHYPTMAATTYLRNILRSLPCRPSELPHFRTAIVGMFRDSPQPDEVTAREVAFHLQSMKHQRELNERYFPQSNLSDKERIANLAKTVGLQVPEDTSSEIK